MINWVFDNPDEYTTMSRCPDTSVKNAVMLSGRFPMPNLVWYWKEAYRWAKGQDIKTEIYSVDNRPNNYIYNIGVWADPTVWAGLDGNKFGYKNLFEYVPPEVLEDARNNRAILAVDNLAEGFYNELLYEFWHRSCAHYNIPPKSILYLTSNELDKKGYHNWAERNNVTDLINVVGFCHFEYQFQKFSNDNLTMNWDQHIVRKTALGNRVKTFNCLNRISREHREFLIIKLIEAGLHKYGIVSHNTIDLDDWKDYYKPEESLYKAAKILPLVADDADFDNNKSMQFNPNLYLNSWISVITETHAVDEPYNFFISEKTWKPIYAMHPFMVLGHKGTLARLHEMGYKTFDGLIDERYDQYDKYNFLSRATAIVHNLQFLNLVRDKMAWFESCKDICLHNRNVFTARDFFESKEYNDIIAIYSNLNK